MNPVERQRPGDMIDCSRQRSLESALPSNLALLIAVLAACLFACGSSSDEPNSTSEWPCEISSAEVPDFLERVGCQSDFDLLASAPLDTTIPGARSLKVVLDRRNAEALYFQNSTKYRIHHAFAFSQLSQSGLKVPLIAEFNRTQYYQPDRRFLLGAVTYYEQPEIWALEIAPYDTMSAAMIEKLYFSVKSHGFFGERLAFVPSSENVSAEARKLPSTVRLKTTQDLFDGIDYQPLNLGRTIGRLRFMRAADLSAEYVGARDLVVLDAVPNDLSVVSGLITEQFQTPLSHVNVLAQNRKTPNMGLRNAMQHPELRALEGDLVELVVGANEWTIREASFEEATEFWDATAIEPVRLPEPDLTVRDLRDTQEIVDESEGSLSEAIQKATLAFGAKTANYGVLVRTPIVGDPVRMIPIRKAFGIPVYYYVQFMEENGFYDRIREMLGDPTFQGDPAERDARLAELRRDMGSAPVNQEFQNLLREKLEVDFPGLTMRFRTSTNAEDLDGFLCAGCYESHTGDPARWDTDLLGAIRDTWASVWFFRTFEERAYHGIDHLSVGMGLLVHHNFPDEEANGVALTANPFDPDGIEPGFYVNVQWGGQAEVVHPTAGATSDEFLYFFESPNQPTTFLSHSNLVLEGQRVLSRGQTYQLGEALKSIHERYSPAYGPRAGNHGWFAMDVEFKFDDEDNPGEEPRLWIKQARPHPGRGQ